MIEVRNLVKRYGDHVAVDHLNFTVEKGQIYGFLGPNGAGKSTTMNIMTGYLALTEGEVIVNGHNILEEPEAAKRCIGYLPEQPPLYTDMTVTEYLRFVAELKSIPRQSRLESVYQVIELTHLTEVEGRLIRNLSKGYRQRVGLAQAILGFPEIIILDEPTVGLDPKQIIEIRDLIRSLAKEHTLIISSHILSEIQELCDHVLIIHHGKLLASGTPAELEAQLDGSTLDLSVKCADPEALHGILSAVDGVREVTCTPDGTGLVSVHISASQSTDPREAISLACAGAGYPVLMMKGGEISLEQIFLEITGADEELAQEAAAAEEAAAQDEEVDADAEDEQKEDEQL